MQETFLQGLNEDEDIPFRMVQDTRPLGPSGPQERKAEVPAKVIDLAGFIAEMEANPEARKRS